VVVFVHRVWAFLRSDKGQTLVEYALILLFVMIVVFVGLEALPDTPVNAMDELSGTLSNS